MVEMWNTSKNRDVVQLGPIQVRLIYFDSMGAKCSSVLVKTPDVSILVDPGAAGLQPSFPLSEEDKRLFLMKAYRRIRRFGAQSDVIIVTHYHYDHHPSPKRLDRMDAVFRGKTLLIKDPNQWINKSQSKRALRFLSALYQNFGGDLSFEDLLVPSNFRMENDPFTSHPRTSARWHKAQGKKKRVFKAKLNWFKKTIKSWQDSDWVPDFHVGGTRVVSGDGKNFTFGKTRLQFSLPMFHGQFLDNVGWVIGFTVEYKDHRFTFTSDLEGPIIEEYAHWIAQSRPDLVVADGPPLYAYGYMIGKTDLTRVIKNISIIMSKARPKQVILDHHLCRGPFRSRLKKAYAYSKKAGVKLCTAAEQLGRKPVIEQLEGEKL